MKYIQGAASGPAIINNGPNPTAYQPSLSMAGSWFSQPISMVGGNLAPDMVVITIAYTAAGSPAGSLFLQGSSSTFEPPLPGSTQPGPGPNDWSTLPNTLIVIGGTMPYNQTVNTLSLPLQPAVFRLNTAQQPIGMLFLRVGYGYTAGGIGDVASVWCVAVVNSLERN